MKKYAYFIFGLCILILTAARPATPGYGLGDIVEEFRLKNVDGKMIGLSDYSNVKGVIVIFDCNTCPYSKSYNDRIIELHETYAPKGFPVLTINSNEGAGDSFEDMVARQKARDIVSRIFSTTLSV